MAWKSRIPEWLNTPWDPEYYPWLAESYPWLVENPDVDWTPRTIPSS